MLISPNWMSLCEISRQSMLTRTRIELQKYRRESEDSWALFCEFALPQAWTEPCGLSRSGLWLSGLDILNWHPHPTESLIVMKFLLNIYYFTALTFWLQHTKADLSTTLGLNPSHHLHSLTELHFKTCSSLQQSSDYCCLQMCDNDRSKPKLKQPSNHYNLRHRAQKITRISKSLRMSGRSAQVYSPRQSTWVKIKADRGIDHSPW